MRITRTVLSVAIAAAIALTHSAQPSGQGANAIVAGELVVEPATLINLGFEWFVEGDANRNAAVSVAFRKPGDGEWRPALPLLRLGGERIYAESRVDVVVPPMFAGSVLDLQPDTAYEVRLLMSDPDGVSGETRRVVTVRTRAEPMPAAGGRVFHVYPHGFAGAKIEPAFEGPDVRLSLLVRGHRLGDVGAAAGAARRHHPGARRRLQVQPLRVHQQRRREPQRAARRHVLPHRGRHAPTSRSRSRRPATVR